MPDNDTDFTPRQKSTIYSLIVLALTTILPRPDDNDVIRHPTDSKLFQLKGTQRATPDCWFTSNLFWSYATTDEEKAFIRTNVGTDENGELDPIYGQMFAQADTWNDDGIAVGTSPQVYGVTQDEHGAWQRDTHKRYTSPPGVNHPTTYAARFKTPDQLIEWARRSAIAFDNPGAGTGTFLPGRV